MSTVAFLGLGHMGGPMAANLVVAGHTVRVFDPVAANKDAAAEKGAQAFDNVAQAASESDVVITSLPNGDIVKSVYADALPAAPKGTLFIDTSTISVDDARTIHAQATEHGHAQLDAPVSGGVKGAVAGTLAFMVGGEAEAVERARAVLEPLAGKIIHCGDSGTGQAAKLCNNMVLAVQQIVAGEAFVLAEKLGLSAQSLFDVITGATGNCWAIHTNCPVPGPVPTSPANNDFKPGFATALMHKDIGLAMDAVQSTGSTAPLGTHAAEIYADFIAVNESNSDKDFSAVIELIRKG
jgi:3-hydroxyisobutyrate dehydrogenase